MVQSDFLPAKFDLEGQHFTVVGAGGFVGSRLLAKLRTRGAQAWAPARNESLPWNRPLGHVLYCAGLTADYLARPFDTVHAHVCLLSQILKYEQFDSLVYLSSTRLYDGLGVGLAHENAVLPMDPSNPRHLYDLSKGLGESLCHVVGQGRARVARLACVYEGPHDTDGFLPALLRQVQAARGVGESQVEVQSSPHFARDYVCLDDVVDALIRIALRGQQSAYNVASGANVSNAELFKYLESRWGCQVFPQSQAASAPAPQVNVERMRVELQWHPRSLFDVLDTYRGVLAC